jgi:type IV pilus assembly protein PilX
VRNRLERVRIQSKQSGVVLFVALILLVILSLIGVTAARMQTVEERMARNENSRQVAEQAGEAALRNGEDVLLTVDYNLFLGNTAGYYFMPVDGSLPISKMTPAFAWNVAANVLAYSGPAMTNAPLVAQSPKIVIEEMPSVTGVGETENSDPTAPPNMFRVTVQAANADGTPSVILQSIFHNY